MIETFLIVGGASAYAPGLVQALLRHSERHDLSCVRLYDIAEERLNTVSTLCRNLSRAAGRPFRVEATTEQAEAVQGIDALLNSSRPGGFECRHIDETLPLEFGIPGQETVGPGGFFFALRSIPAAIDLADDVIRHAPEAIWLNYTNPTNIVGQALCDTTDLDTIALCDQFDEDLGALADAMGFDPGTPYDFRCSGLNHATWYRDVTIGGQPLELASRDLETPSYFDAEHALRFRHSARAASRHGTGWPNSYLPYYDYPEDFVDLSQRIGTRTEAILDGLEDYYEHFREEARRDEPDLRHHRGSKGFGDMALDVVAALSSDEATDIVVNIPNRGVVDGFDDATVVESFASLSSSGVERTDAPPMPEHLRPLLESLERYQRLTAEAAVSGDFNALRNALAANPLVGAPATAEAMLDRARDAYGDALPQLRT